MTSAAHMIHAVKKDMDHMELIALTLYHTSDDLTG